MTPTQGQNSPTLPFPPGAGSSRAAGKPLRPQRVLACVLCQQRKVKCDRKFPCANCVKVGSQCVPATLTPPQRRRKFPVRELLERLRHYESLLRQNNIKFEPIHLAAAHKASASEDSRGCASPSDGHPEGTVEGADRPSTKKTTTSSDTFNLWDALNQKSRDPKEDEDNEDDDDDDDNDSDFSHGDVHDGTIKKAWDHFPDINDDLLFGSCKTNVDLSTLHPEHVQIFKLWQVYLDNVNPLLKVTHTPTLQASIIDAASNMANTSPTLEALMFSVYCVAILSLMDDECRTLFGSSREELLNRYQFGCRQALLHCGVLRSDDRDCLTALYLYLVSVKPDTDARPLSSILGVAVRIAQRMGIQDESTYAKCSALEAEMRRRLWWSLVIFDNRVCEMSNNLKATMLVPTWDCKTPSNVNDFEIRPEMKTPPVIHHQPTEALFAVVRSELGDFIRHSDFHLDFTNPSLKALAKDALNGPVLEGGKLIALERMMEEKYLRNCNTENPLHFMTTWTTRGYLAKNRLLEHYSRYSRPSVQQTDAQRDAAISYALSMIECDTKLISSPLTKGYLWHAKSHFPFIAYIHVVQDLRKRPIQEYDEKAWEVMSEDYKVRFADEEPGDNPFFTLFARIVLQAWEAREAAFRHLDRPLEPPPIVVDIKRKVMPLESNAQDMNMQQLDGAMGMNIDDFSMPMSMDFGSQGLPYSIGSQAGPAPGGYPDPLEQPPMDFDMNQLDWTTMGWNPMSARGW